MIWHDIPEYPGYQISKSCIIRKKYNNLRGNDRLVVKQTSDGNYLGVKLKHESGRWARVKVHVLMMAVFVGPRPPGLVINHVDGNKHNNFLSNLEYCTNLENERHSLRVLNKINLRDQNGKFCSSTTHQRVV
jgi:hypothetical protein